MSAFFSLKLDRCETTPYGKLGSVAHIHPSDQGEDNILIPKNAGGAMGSRYDWNYTTIAQTSINNRQIGIPSGKVVGGATVLNGMAFDRGSASDYDAWVDLGNPGWGFSDLLPYFKKSETFTPPSPEMAAEFNITWDMSVRGTDGPIFATYPRYLPSTHSKSSEDSSSCGMDS